MKDIVKLGATLMIYAALAGLFLGWVYTKTAPQIAKQQRLERERAIREVMPAGATVFDEDTLPDGTVVVVGYADETKERPVGYAAVAVGAGFSSNIKTMVGLNTDLTVSAIKVLYQSETPGLGTHTQDEWFQKQFAGKGPEELLVDKDGGAIKSITGATISSRAVANSVRALVEKLRASMAGSPQPQNAEADTGAPDRTP